MKVVSGFAACILAMLTSAPSVYAADVEPVPMGYDWSGAYIGLHAGYLWGDVGYKEPEYADSSISRHDDAFIGGLYLGFNHQMDSLVLGVEGDVGFGGIDIDNDEDDSTNDYSAFESDWNGHVRGRLGFAFDRTLLFAAGGLAITDLKINDTDPGWGDDTKTHVGWTIGGGVEFAVSDSVVVRGEYLYDDYGSEDYKIDGDYTYRARADLTASTVRIGVAYKF